MATTPVSYGWIDHSAEPSRTQLHFEELLDDGSNFEAVLGDAGKADLMRLALEAVTKLNETRVTASVKIHGAVGSIPTDPTAQRETAARMIYVDNVTGQKYRFDIPAPADAYVPTGTDDINMADTDWVVFKTAFELNCVSPDENPVTLISGRYVGRRN